MSAKLVDIDGHHVVFGLDWVPLTGETAEKKEVRNLVADMDAAFEVRYSNDHAIMYGFLADSAVPDDLPKAAKSKLLSPSVLLATFPQITANAIWIEIDGQSARMAVLKDGLPMPSGDFYGDIGEAEERIRQIEADSGDVSFSYFGNFDAVYSSTIPITLEDLVREGGVAAATLKKASRGIEPKQLVLLAVLFGVGMYLALPSFHHKPVKRVQKQEDPNVVYQRTIGEKLSAAGTPITVAAPALFGNWNIETLQGGWSLSKISCQISQCVYTWAVQGGNFLSLVDALGKQQYDLSLDGKTASYSVASQPVQSVSLDRTRFATFEQFKLIEGSLAQDLALVGVTLTFDQPTVFGADPKLNASALHDVVRSGVITGSGRAALLKDTIARMNDSIVIDQIEVTTNGLDPKFSFQGKYYVKD
ncbi:type 4b pilus protein PilO2 [Paraburkholderia hospita]|uniref:type 4b pilus protein PilO2 n=1 Tax=Paraburkholderia hospita TaxID=169430 RepID=UPI0008A7C694|nr:type 4b pilus protein PilO2 [Paraburkholderia hospita]SEI14509.1 Pilin accessory protein (PilO) [Paraburkholderia hospita]